MKLDVVSLWFEERKLNDNNFRELSEASATYL